MRFETQVIHAGVEPDAQTGAVMTPIYQTSTYAQSSPGIHQGFEYSRTDNPTRSVLQRQLAVLESAEQALVFSSGLAAIDAVVNLLRQGDHVVAGADLYGGTFRHFTKVASDRGIEITFANVGDESRLRAAMRPETRLVWFETPTNPTMTIVDIGSVSRIAHEYGALCAVDNTFMSPAFQKPLTHGADIAMHSMTKYINGHSDVVMGALMFDDLSPGWLPNDQGDSLFSRLKFLQNAVGAVPGPFDCFLALRGIKTLAVRMERHASNALKIARYLADHRGIERVLYPGLPGHPGHDAALRQTTGHGGMLTFLLKGEIEEARTFLERVRLFTLAESLGGVESLIEHPAIMTHSSIPPETRKEIGIFDNLVRVSVGIENVDDLIEDLDQALTGLA